MNITESLIRIVFLALPGLVGSGIYRKLTPQRSAKDWEDYREIILFSLISYSLLSFVIIPVWNGLDLLHKVGIALTSTYLQALFDNSIPLPFPEIVFASVIAVFASFIATLSYTHYWINKFARWIRVTRRFNEVDVWDFFLNSPTLQTWVWVRDHKYDLAYYGWIINFSDSEKERELVMTRVTVYKNSTGEKLYDTDASYFSRDRHDLTIEIPVMPRNDQRPATHRKEKSNGRERKRK